MPQLDVFTYFSISVYFFFTFSVFYTLVAYCIFPVFNFVQKSRFFFTVVIKIIIIFIITYSSFFNFDVNSACCFMVTPMVTIYTFWPGTIKPVKLAASRITVSAITKDEMYFMMNFPRKVLELVQLKGHRLRDSYLFVLFSQYNCGNDERLYDMLVRMFENSRPVSRVAFQKRWVIYADAGIKGGPTDQLLKRFEAFFDFCYKTYPTHPTFTVDAMFITPLDWLCDFYNALLDLCVFLAEFHMTVAHYLKSIDGHGEIPDYWKLKPWIEQVLQLKIDAGKLFDQGAPIFDKLDPASEHGPEIIPYIITL